ncbi:MAG TPA: Hsp70 family protein, partial [Candidatus Binataceae bacterium]|nr:Hsp70 family protein [Candidatus Binataceae bacterium]
EECVERLLGAARIAPAKIDSVFLTGRSSFVPAVRRIFVERFGAGKIRMGNEFTSVARGLALRALD